MSLTVVSDAPWTRASTRRAVAVQAFAVLMGLIAWFGANAQDGVRGQLAWMNLAVTAALVAAVAQAWWLLMARQAVSLHRRELLRRLERDGATQVAPAAPRGLRVAVEGSSWHHDAGCLLVQGKALVVVGPAADLEPCDVCSG